MAPKTRSQTAKNTLRRASFSVSARATGASRTQRKAAQDAAEGDGEPLRSAAELSEEADGKMAESKAAEQAASAAMVSNFPRMLGDALKSRIASGSKEHIKRLLHEMDSNGDGVLQKIELRQMVRNNLKLRADNATIDAFFDSIDVDRSDSIELDELVAACHKLMDATEEAREEAETLLEKAERAKQRAETISKAATAMREVEEEEARLQRAEHDAAAAGSLALDARIGSALVRRAVKAAELSTLLDTKHTPSVGRTEFAQKMAELQLQPPAAAGEAEALYDALLAAQEKGRDVGGSDQLDSKRVVKTLIEYAARHKELEKEASVHLSQLRAAARKLQRAVSVAMESSFKRHQDSFQQRQAEADEAAAREAAAKAAKAEAAKAKAKAKAEEKAEFEAKVEARRRAQKEMEVALSA